MRADTEDRAPLRVLADQRAVGEALAAALTIQGIPARGEVWGAPSDVDDGPDEPDGLGRAAGPLGAAAQVAGVICCAVDDGLALAHLRAYLARSPRAWVVVVDPPSDARWGALYASGACEVVSTGRGLADLVSAVQRSSTDDTRRATQALFRDWVTSCPAEAGILESLTGMPASGRAALRRLDHGGSGTATGGSRPDADGVTEVTEAVEGSVLLTAIDRLGVADELAAAAALRALDASPLFEHSPGRSGAWL